MQIDYNTTTDMPYVCNVCMHYYMYYNDQISHMFYLHVCMYVLYVCTECIYVCMYAGILFFS